MEDPSINNNEIDRKRHIESTAALTEIDKQLKDDVCAKKKKTAVKDIKNNSNKEQEDVMRVEGRKDVFYLLVTNFPYQWSCEQMTDYIHEHCVDVYAVQQLDSGDLYSGQSIRLLFLNFEKCIQAKKQLKLKAVEGRKLNVTFSFPGDSDSDGDTNTDKSLLVKRSTPSLSIPDTMCKSNIDMWSTDQKGLYGLKSTYLESLAIVPPIDKWVHISNFRCDRTELKEVMELAGQVLICRVFDVSQKYAKVMYSHPLEAVQAVSMLNGQIFYGQVLKVSMYKCPSNDFILPKGLKQIGPGLGRDGKPLTDIVQQYTRYLNGQNNSINEYIFNQLDPTVTESNGPNGAINIDNIRSLTDVFNEKEDINEKSEKHLEQQCTGSATNDIDAPQSQTQNNPQIVSQGPMSAQLPTFTNQPITSHLQNNSPDKSMPRFNVPNQNPHQGPVAAFVSTQNFQMLPLRMPCSLHVTHTGPIIQQRFHNPVVPYHNTRNVRPPLFNNPYNRAAPGPNMNNTPRLNMEPNSTMLIPRERTSTAVEISNIPISTAFTVLSEQMALVGQVISMELTRPGCALVRFANPTHAERCYQHFNNMCVMGNVLKVKFI